MNKWRKVGLCAGVLLAGTAGSLALAQHNQRFAQPMISNYRLDWCLHWAQDCGKPAADAWCSQKGGKAGGYAAEWEIDADIGAASPTYVMGDKKVCDQQFCDGFKFITCEFAGGE